MSKRIHVAYHEGHEAPLEVALEYADSVVTPGATPVQGTEDGNSIQLSNGKYLIFDHVSVERLPNGVGVLELYEWANEADSVVPTPTTESDPAISVAALHKSMDPKKNIEPETAYKPLISPGVRTYECD